MAGLLIGLAAGYFGGLVGLGGGVVMIPLMVGVLRFSQHKAHGTSLVALVFTGLAGAFSYAREGSVDVLAAVLLASTAIFTARFGARFAHALPEWKLRRSFGAFLIAVSLLLLLKPYIFHASHRIGEWPEALILLFVGLFTGFLSGMMGVGGGSLMVPAMVLLTGFSQHTAQGSSLLAMVPAGAVGAYTHWRLGNVNAQILPGLILGIIAGSYLGGFSAHLLSEGALRAVFAAVLIWTGARYLRTPRPKEEKEAKPEAEPAASNPGKSSPPTT
ncbi:sulfite exporter TauE/SafE family protein [Ammonifex thiophilus]|uniref:Probable membrane transporter protein n=1 Tax=Ammonifex thiophilus TaxID=444093 RepID=A0A3D8P3J2_9THEO|nr:sulfite exporter TauE/SafE family protein [Ammonifex thiophilus]